MRFLARFHNDVAQGFAFFFEVSLKIGSAGAEDVNWFVHSCSKLSYAHRAVILDPVLDDDNARPTFDKMSSLRDLLDPGERVFIQLITRSKHRNPLIACALFATVLTLSSSAKSADLPTFVDLPSGLIIGAHAGGKWLSSEQAGKALEPGRKYRLFTLTGKDRRRRRRQSRPECRGVS